MSTYTDLRNTVKETINVDYRTRITPQLVHFVNPENSYQGLFIGEISAKGNNSILGGTIANVVLSNALLDNIAFKSGINLDDINQNIVDLSNTAGSEKSKRIAADIALCNEISATNINLALEKTERHNADVTLSIDLTKTINFEADKSRIRYNTLNDKIDLEISNRISADEFLEKQVNDKMLHDRHLEMHLIDNREFPLSIHDYAVNTYVDSNANAYVYENGDTKKLPIGKIEKAKFNSAGELISFEFNAFAENPNTYELTAAGIFLYYFDKDNTVKYTGVGGYRLNCDVTKCTTLNDTQFTLDSANNNGYYNVYFSSSINKAARIDANYKCDDAGMISSCSLTITTEELSNFALTTPFKFEHSRETKTFKGKNGNWCEATLSDNTFILYDSHEIKHYIPVLDSTTSDEFARVYDGGVILAFDGSLREIDVDTLDGKHFELNTSNGFKQTFDAALPYKKISYDITENKVYVKEEKKYYKYGFKGSNNTLIPGLSDIPNKKIDDDYATVGVLLLIDSASLAPYLNGDYVLNLVDSGNKYEVERTILLDDFGKVKLSFIKDEKILNVDISPKTAKDTIHLFYEVDMVTIPTEIDESTTYFTSKKLCDDIKSPRDDEKRLDDTYKNKYVLVPDLTKKEYSGESKVLISQAKIEKKDTLTLLMPNKSKQIPNDYTTASSKFILNFKVYTESLKDDDFVTLIIKSHEDVDKFYYMNKEVRKIFIKKNKWTTLKFEELRPHRYVINDLDYSEIDWRLKWLHNELSCHEISSYETMMKLSDDVEFLLSVDRETMNYKGTLPQMAPSSPLDGVIRLSAFISQSPYIYGGILKLGDMFKLSAPQYGVSAIYDKYDISTYLGENDYFIVNSPLLSVQDVAWTNLDIFRNSESEYAFLSIELTNQINSTSSYIVGEINRICAELSNELSACELSVNGLSIEVDRISAELSTELNKCELSINGLSIEVDRISSAISSTIYRLSTELSTELCACELSVNGLSVRTSEICAEISTMLSLSVDSLQKQISCNDVELSTISTDLSVLSHHYYDKTMSCDLVLEHIKGSEPHRPEDHISAVVDKLLIVDEVTFDLYALTIRNGALNINKVKTITENYHTDCCCVKK